MPRPYQFLTYKYRKSYLGGVPETKDLPFRIVFATLYGDIHRRSDYESEGWGFDSLRVHQHSSTAHICYTTPWSLIKKSDKGQILP